MLPVRKSAFLARSSVLSATRSFHEVLAVTDEDANLEACRRWGAEAYVRHRRNDPLLPWRPDYAVGRQAGNLFDVRGQGDSWEEAFADADAKWR
jgi:hypothetical protein